MIQEGITLSWIALNTYMRWEGVKNTSGSLGARPVNGLSPKGPVSTESRRVAYSPECVEGLFSEVRLIEFSEGRAKLEAVASCLWWKRLARLCKGGLPQ